MGKVILKKETDNPALKIPEQEKRWEQETDLSLFRNNSKVFLPDSQLDSRTRTLYLNWLIRQLEQETGKLYTAMEVHKTIPYEINGVYIQLMPELLDSDRQYTFNNDTVYGKDGMKYHVSYYREGNGIKFLLDNPDTDSGYFVTNSMREFSHTQPEVCTEPVSVQENVSENKFFMFCSDAKEWLYDKITDMTDIIPQVIRIFPVFIFILFAPTITPLAKQCASYLSDDTAEATAASASCENIPAAVLSCVSASSKLCYRLIIIDSENNQKTFTLTSAQQEKWNIQDGDSIVIKRDSSRLFGMDWYTYYLNDEQIIEPIDVN